MMKKNYRENKILRVLKGIYGVTFLLFIFFSSLHIFSISVEVDLSRYLHEIPNSVLKRSFELTNKFHVVNQYGLFRRFFAFLII